MVLIHNIIMQKKVQSKATIEKSTKVYNKNLLIYDIKLSKKSLQIFFKCYLTKSELKIISKFIKKCN